MRSGLLDRQITVERKAVPSDPEYVAPDASFGTEQTVWVPLVVQPGSPPLAERFWAEVQDPLPSRSESVTEGLVIARNQTRIRMRYRDDIDSSMRVRLHGDGEDVIYQIIGGPAVVTREGRKSMIEMACERFSS